MNSSTFVKAPLLLIVLAFFMSTGCATVGIEKMVQPQEAREPEKIRAWFWQKAFWTGCLSDLQTEHKGFAPTKECN